MDLEHMIPRNPKSGEKIPHHEMQTDKLGNYIVLDPEDNQVASNKEYQYKKKKVYDDLNLKLSDNLPSEAKSEEINDRSEEIANRLVEFL